jgi:hypothetical protein
MRRERDHIERACRRTSAWATEQRAEQMELLAAVAGHLGACAGNLEQGSPVDGLDVDAALLAHLLRNRPCSCL